MYYVYKLTQIESGKSYIGKTYDLHKRLLKHLNAAKNGSDFIYIELCVNMEMIHFTLKFYGKVMSKTHPMLKFISYQNSTHITPGTI